MNGGNDNDGDAVAPGTFGEGSGGQTPEDIRAALAAPGQLDPDAPVSVLSGTIEDPAAAYAAVEAGAVVERYPRDSMEDVGLARARFRELGPGRWTWSVARRRGKGEIPEVPDRVARGDCASLAAAREAVAVMVPWVLASDEG